MYNAIIHQNAAKKAANLSINSEALALAKKYNINLSQTLEAALIKLIREMAKKEWLAENRDAIEHYNNRVKKNGVFSDHVRKF